MSSIRAVVVLVALMALAPAPARASEAVLYVGDSLGVGTVPNLERSMAVESDTRVGRASGEGLAVLRTRLRRGHEIVVFDMGTNDVSPDLVGRHLRRARALSGERLMIVFTLNKPNARPFNRVIRSFARSSDNVGLIDWHAAAVREHLLGADGIHASPWGYRRRAALVLPLMEAVK